MGSHWDMGSRPLLIGQYHLVALVKADWICLWKNKLYTWTWSPLESSACSAGHATVSTVQMRTPPEARMFEDLVPIGDSLERIRRRSGWRRCVAGVGFEISKDFCSSLLALSSPAFGSRRKQLPIMPLLHPCWFWLHSLQQQGKPSSK